MINTQEIIKTYEKGGFLVAKLDDKYYSIRAPSWLETDTTIDMHEYIMDFKVEIKATIAHMLILALECGLIIIED